MAALSLRVPTGIARVVADDLEGEMRAHLDLRAGHRRGLVLYSAAGITAIGRIGGEADLYAARLQTAVDAPLIQPVEEHLRRRSAELIDEVDVYGCAWTA